MGLASERENATRRTLSLWKQCGMKTEGTEEDFVGGLRPDKCVATALSQLAPSQAGISGQRDRALNIMLRFAACVLV